MISREKEAGFGWKLEDFEFSRHIYLFAFAVQHLHFFEKKSKKYKRNTKQITKNTKWWN
jgi:hypothetical protein